MAPAREAPAERGRKAEELACRHLQARGLHLLARNWKIRLGELDLVMDHGGTIVFVEVRYRGHGAWSDGAASVDPRKQRRLVAAAQAWLQGHRGADRPCRFDVVSVGPDGELEWIVNAFDSG